VEKARRALCNTGSVRTSTTVDFRPSTHILLSSRHFGFNLLDPLQDRHDANRGGAKQNMVAAVNGFRRAQSPAKVRVLDSQLHSLQGSQPIRTKKAKYVTSQSIIAKPKTTNFIFLRTIPARAPCRPPGDISREIKLDASFQNSHGSSGEAWRCDANGFTSLSLSRIHRIWCNAIEVALSLSGSIRLGPLAVTEFSSAVEDGWNDALFIDVLQLHVGSNI
jgi:hypothetical protein